MVKENLQGLLLGAAASLIPAASAAALTVGINLLVGYFLSDIGGQIAKEMLE